MRLLRKAGSGSHLESGLDVLGQVWWRCLAVDWKESLGRLLFVGKRDIEQQIDKKS